MSISDPVPTTGPGASPARVLADAVAAVRELAETWWSARSDDELVEVVSLVQQATSALAAVEAGAVVEVTPGTWRSRSCTTPRPGTGCPTWAVCGTRRASTG